MRFIDFFAGVGGFRMGMELAGHECVGFCEFDRFAVASYTSMHLITEEQRKHLESLDLKKRQKEILKEEYKNGEWYANDVRTVDARSMPKADCWCFGFPCQDISVAGKQLGFNGSRSSLFFAVTKLIDELEEKDRPKYLFIENVKNLLSVNGGFDFAKLLIELDRVGYDAEWQICNSKDFGVPQNRERVFVIGHLRGRGGSKIFPIEGDGGENCVSVKQIARCPGTNRDNPNQYRVYEKDALSPTLSKMDGGGREPHVAIPIKEVVQVSDDLSVYAIWYEKYGCYIAIRKLTPKECFRLQGWSDDCFEKARFVNSDSQLYKQAGNGVTVSVIEAIGRKMSLASREG